MKNFTKIALSAVLGLAVILPAMANTTTIQMDADVLGSVSVQVIKTTGGAIVSQDDADENAIGNLVLDFGVVDARGISLDTANFTASIGGTTNVTLARFLIAGTTAHDVATPPAQTDGALYFVNGYSILTTASGVADNRVDVAIDATGNVQTFASQTAPTATGTVSFFDGAGNDDDPAFIDNNPNDAPKPISVGLYIENDTEAGDVSSTLTFTGTQVGT